MPLPGIDCGVASAMAGQRQSWPELAQLRGVPEAIPANNQHCTGVKWVHLPQRFEAGAAASGRFGPSHDLTLRSPASVTPCHSRQAQRADILTR
jgi:hypothetical protein